MDFAGYQRLAARTMNPSLTSNETEMHAVFGICSEAGEIAGIFQKAYQGHEVRADDLKEELGDLLWFLCELCTINNYSFDDIACGNIDKLRVRYPGDGFSDEDSIRRVDHRGV